MPSEGGPVGMVLALISVKVSLLLCSIANCSKRMFQGNHQLLPDGPWAYIKKSNLISYNINLDMKLPLAESGFNSENHKSVNNQNQRELRKSLPIFICL
jgi:hypothetical protein